MELSCQIKGSNEKCKKIEWNINLYAMCAGFFEPGRHLDTTKELGTFSWITRPLS